jgi:hypothetical protein
VPTWFALDDRPCLLRRHLTRQAVRKVRPKHQQPVRLHDHGSKCAHLAKAMPGHSAVAEEINRRLTALTAEALGL